VLLLISALEAALGSQHREAFRASGEASLRRDFARGELCHRL